MFALRGIAVSISVFVIVYCALSLAIGFAWRRIRGWAREHRAQRIADLLFTLRLFPLATAAIITAAFTVPSFVLLEPRAIEEPLGGIPLTLGVFGIALGIYGVANALLALLRASQTISTWTRGASSTKPEASASLRVWRIIRAIPPMTAVGIVRPRVLLSGAGEAALSRNEMRMALNHEIAHIQRRDNLRKLMLKLVAFPGLRSLETAWLEATEMAADDAAVSTAGEALDLAAALIKLSKLGTTEASDLTAAIVSGPASMISARVERLLTWSAPRRQPLRPSHWYVLAAPLATVATLAIAYSQILAGVHAATEWLVR